MTDLPERNVTRVDDRNLAWREAGSGPALVLVHGIGGHAGSWRNQLTEFSSSHRVIAWDAPGYGGSDPLGIDAPRASDYSSVLAAFLRTLGVSSAHLVGHSLGSIMIASLCKAHGFVPEGLTFLQPVTGTGLLPDEKREAIRKTRIDDMTRLGAREFAIQRGRTILSPKATPSAVTDALEVMMVVPQQGYLAAWDMMCAEDLFSLIEPRHRTMVVCGSDDPVSPPETGQAIADRIPNSAFHVLKDVGHYAALEAPDRLNAILRDFITSKT